MTVDPLMALSEQLRDMPGAIPDPEELEIRLFVEGYTLPDPGEEAGFLKRTPRRDPWLAANKPAGSGSPSSSAAQRPSGGRNSYGASHGSSGGSGPYPEGGGDPSASGPGFVNSDQSGIINSDQSGFINSDQSGISSSPGPDPGASQAGSSGTVQLVGPSGQ